MLLRPKRLRKYHERELTQVTSRSCVSTPRCIIDLNRKVSGNGSRAVHFSAQMYHRKAKNGSADVSFLCDCSVTRAGGATMTD